LATDKRPIADLPVPVFLERKVFRKQCYVQKAKFASSLKHPNII
jgi:hypothetical protein